jgi:phage tail sheath gpL-like
MTISTGVPSNWNIPLFWATVDGSMAGGLANQPQSALLVGQYNSTTGTINGGVNVPVAVPSPAAGTAMFGAGSMLDRMVQAFFLVNVNQLVWALPVSDPSGGVAATGTVAFSGSATAAGTVFIYIAGQLVSFAVNAGDSATTMGTNFSAACAALPELPVAASGSAGTITLTCNWKGSTGNDIQIIPNYYGPGNMGLIGSGFTGISGSGYNSGQVLPPGVVVTITPMSGGTGVPTWTNAISAIQMFPYQYVALPYTDSGTLTTWNNEFGFGSGGRWSYSRQQYGFVCSAYRASTYSAALTAGAGWNYPVISIMCWEAATPSPVWECAAAYCGLAALGFSEDPARPLQTLEMPGILPATLPNRFNQAQQNNLTNTGFAVQAVAPDGNPMILREQTTYQLNSFGQPDIAFGLLTVLATLAALLTRMKSAITSKYPRVKLIPNGTLIGPGQAAVTPNDILAELVSEFYNAMYDGLVDNPTAFIANVIVQISNNNPNVIQVLWPPQLVGQLRSFQALAQFRLLYPPVSAS